MNGHGLPGEERDLARRATIVGRLVLYGITVLAFFFAAAATLSALYLLTPLSDNETFLLWYRVALAGTWLSFLFDFFMLFVVCRFMVPPRDYAFKPLAGARVHVALTAWNDEDCIGDAVREFKARPEAHKVIVVENNSTDRTREIAEAAGADAVITETVPGYGSCCMRALAEAAEGADVIILCEGDMTFSAGDIPKLLAYLENCDLVLGTRATQELRESRTQMDWLINPANQVVAKLIQARFWGTRLTDVGCTYRAMRVPSYLRIKDRLYVQGNHFSPHMYMEALKRRKRVIEIPVVFRHREGVSKGVGSDKWKAAKVALRMLGLLYRA
ncbi:MAG: glycosyltransferase family 2 protein [FCB group bacterium]|jgi:hypothetical protein|nr:glycosyltransferase family 2 protein [FCB group bacterium]